MRPKLIFSVFKIIHFASFLLLNWTSLCLDYLEITILCHVADLKILTVHRCSVVIFAFSGPLGLYGSTLIWEQSSGKPGARQCEGCHFRHNLS